MIHVHQLLLLQLLYYFVLVQSHHNSSIDPFVSQDNAYDHKIQDIFLKHFVSYQSKLEHQQDFKKAFYWQINSISLLLFTSHTGLQFHQHLSKYCLEAIQITQNKDLTDIQTFYFPCPCVFSSFYLSFSLFSNCLFLIVVTAIYFRNS